jgi:DNA-directed RNA polymerase subunit L
MEIKILKQDKKELDIELDNLTIAELLRNYLNQEGADLAVWKREHPTKPIVLHIEADNPKTFLKKAIEKLRKDLDSTLDEFKKLK